MGAAESRSVYDNLGLTKSYNSGLLTSKTMAVPRFRSLILSRPLRPCPLRVSPAAVPTPFIRTTRSLELDTARGSLVIGVIAMSCLLLWLGWFLFGSVSIYEVSKRARLETGASPREVSALQAGRLTRSTLVIGRQVRAGEVLVELDATAQQLRLQEEQARLDLLPEKAQSFRREIAATQASLGDDQHSALAAVQSARARQSEAGAQAEFARENERRMRAQGQVGGVSEIDALRASAEARRASSNTEALRAEARRMESDARVRARQGAARLEDLQRALLAAEDEIATAETNIARLKAEIEALVIRAPSDGVIGEATPVGPGAFIAQGQKLATIVPGGAVIITAAFDPATGLGRIMPGQTARMRLDGFPWSQYGLVEARVTRVASDVREGLLSVELTPRPSARANALLQHGLSGAVEIQIERVSPARLVVRAAGQALYPAHPPAKSQPQTRTPS